MKYIILILALSGCCGQIVPPPLYGFEPYTSVCDGAPISVQLFGDSTMIGVSGHPGHKIVDQRPAAILQAELNARYGVCAVNVLDHAGGGTALDAINGTDNLKTPLSQIAPAQINVFNHGLNDQHFYPVADYTAYLDSFTIYGGKIIFMTAATGLDPAYTAAMRDVAARRGVPVADLKAYAATVPNLASYFPDTIHGTQDWYLMSVRNVLAPAVFLAVDAVKAGV